MSIWHAINTLWQKAMTSDTNGEPALRVVMDDAVCAWVSTITYQKDDMVSKGGKIWVAQQETTGDDPETDIEGNWKELPLQNVNINKAIFDKQWSKLHKIGVPYGVENHIDTVGIKEVSQITAVADVDGSLGGKYFQLAMLQSSGGRINYTGIENKIDVWFDVDNGNSAPDMEITGAARQIEVNITRNADATTVATAIITALNADVAFNAGRNVEVVRISASIAGNWTNISAGDSGMDVSTIIEGNGYLSGTSKWRGGVLAPNGKIYCIPYSSTVVAIIDPETDTIDTTSITGLSGGAKWYGGVLAPNGKIYCIPYSSTVVAIIDPETDTVDTTSITGLSGTSKWYGGVLAPNGKIYCIPCNSEVVAIIDPETDTIDTTSITGLSGTSKWVGGVLAPNGKIYCIPRDSTVVAMIVTGMHDVPLWMLSPYTNKF